MSASLRTPDIHALSSSRASRRSRGRRIPSLATSMHARHGRRLQTWNCRRLATPIRSSCPCSRSAFERLFRVPHPRTPSRISFCRLLKAQPHTDFTESPARLVVIRVTGQNCLGIREIVGELSARTRISLKTHGFSAASNKTAGIRLVELTPRISGRRPPSRGSAFAKAHETT